MAMVILQLQFKFLFYVCIYLSHFLLQLLLQLLQFVEAYVVFYLLEDSDQIFTETVIERNMSYDV
jgi:phage-related holin